MESITGAPWAGGDVNASLLPSGRWRRCSAGGAVRDVGRAGGGKFRPRIWAHFRANDYAFPGAHGGLDAAFSLPHDSVMC